ncbi:hypothetical protein GALL_216240 [mine drainage metagenome]|uniref:Uncharacterized protein n=1 Tax=mine drainage metagenome TaxID=410659 RepID=A0A1J5S3M0_9ZZZZ
MNTATARVMAIIITAIALVMSGMAGWYRGSSLLDRMLLISISVAISACSHLIPSISKSRVAWALWSCCFIGALYSHLTFFSYTSLHAGDDRSEHSVQVSMAEQQIRAAREALALITARPLVVVASELAVTKNWRRRNALSAELSEAKRASALRDEIVTLLGVARVAEVTSATDPVTVGIARVTGITEQSIAFFSAFGFSVLLELLGAFLWYQSFQGQQEKPQLVNNSPTEDQSISRLRKEVAAGQVEPTVKAIRVFLRCSQTKAMEVRRKIVTESY